MRRTPTPAVSVSRASREARTALGPSGGRAQVALHPPSSSRLARVRDRIQDGFAASHRDLPWRRTRDPYAILVSEAMLQQTRVETVLRFFERFLQRFPST
jgi:A/G-specific adenine glycosylase